MIEMKNRKNMKLFGWAAILLLLVVFVNCKSKKQVALTPGDAGSAKEIYQKAKGKIKKDSDKARLLFKEIMHLYPDSPYAGRAKLGIADSYYRQKDSASLIMAATEYQEFVNLYPNSPDAVYAKLQIGMCYYKQMRKPGRDQTQTHQAVKALESMVKMYPDTEEAKDARAKIAKARQNLAAHYYRIGVTNFRMKAYKGAIARFKDVQDNYPEFKKMDRLYYYTGSSHFGMRDYDTASSFFQRVITTFPKSKLLKDCNKMLKKIEVAKTKVVKRKVLKPKTEKPKAGKGDKK